MKRVERKWMYERLDDNKRIRTEYANGVMKFIKFATENEEYKRIGKLRCPCSKCRNLAYLSESEVKNHLGVRGFDGNYYYWTCHGESFPTSNEDNEPIEENPYRAMVEDALRDRVDQIREEALNSAEHEVFEETPNPEVRGFFEMLRKSELPVFEGCQMSVLQVASRLLSLKCEFNLAHQVVDRITSLIGDMIPKRNVMSRNFYEIKNVLKALQLPHEKIDACPIGCMLFWEENANLDKCSKCGRDRYKANLKSTKKRVGKKTLTYFPLGPRLQRIFATKSVASHMTWHFDNPRASGTMSHPSDGEAWKHFDKEHPEFASDPRNVRLGLCSDGFSPYGQFGKSYSTWPVMVTPYNLPPWLCMKKQFIFLSLIIPGPKNPKSKMDVYLQPLIKELKQLWTTGLYTYDVSKKQNFQLRAAVMWTINDFPAYGMLSGWSTQGHLACPYCHRLPPKSFYLERSRKVCWFDCHRQFLPIEHRFRWKCYDFRKDRPNEEDVAPSRLSGKEIWEIVKDMPTIVNSSDHELNNLKAKKEGWWKQSIFWELPYWKTLLIRHNLDVMHIEKNFFEQLINTVMEVPNKTSFGPKGRLDFMKYCKRRPESSRFVLDKVQKTALCDWISQLKFPDGYASDLSRCVDNVNLKLHAMKSHDCHVFMERLLPVALKELLPTNVWSAITELSQFFRDLCASSLTVDGILKLEKNIAEIICKLEKIFPPSFFNSMEHLPVHLPYEAKVGGPVHYRWMYPYERFLNHIKQKIGNKARVEGSIANAYLLEEISNFCSFYFEDKVDTRTKNLDVGITNDQEDEALPEMFRDHMGSTTGKCVQRYLTDEEYKQAHFYILSNCEMLRPYEIKFEKYIFDKYHQITCTDEIWSKHEKEFPKWFEQQVHMLEDPLLKALALGPSRIVKTWRRYSINGYRFRAFKQGVDVPKATVSNGVYVSSTEGIDTYGTLDEVIEVVYTSSERCYNTILFKCDWIDNSCRGLNVHKKYNLVDVNRSRKYPTYDPFVFAYQVEQVCYTSYPKTRKDNQWSAVFKIKSRSNFDIPIEDIVFQEEINVDPHTLSSVEADEVHTDDLDNVGLENEVVDDIVELNETEIQEGDEEEEVNEEDEEEDEEDEEEDEEEDDDDEEDGVDTLFRDHECNDDENDDDDDDDY